MSAVLSEWYGVARSLLVYWRPGRQRALRALYAQFVRPDDLVFDVGAHLGDRTTAFAALGARVVALEPQPVIARWLRRIVGHNPRIEVREVAAGARPGTARLAVSRRTPTVSTLSPGWSARVRASNPGFEGVRWEDTVEVPVVTLDALIEAHGVPAFCKVDVEGYEDAVLEGLSRPVRALSFEFVRGDLERAVACVRRLDSLGTYRFNAVRGEGRTFVLACWTPADRMVEWLRSGAADASSGDVYALLEAGAGGGERPS